MGEKIPCSVTPTLSNNGSSVQLFICRAEHKPIEHHREQKVFNDYFHTERENKYYIKKRAQSFYEHLLPWESCKQWHCCRLPRLTSLDLDEIQNQHPVGKTHLQTDLPLSPLRNTVLFPNCSMQQEQLVLFSAVTRSDDTTNGTLNPKVSRS